MNRLEVVNFATMKTVKSIMDLVSKGYTKKSATNIVTANRLTTALGRAEKQYQRKLRDFTIKDQKLRGEKAKEAISGILRSNGSKKELAAVEAKVNKKWDPLINSLDKPISHVNKIKGLSEKFLNS